MAGYLRHIADKARLPAGALHAARTLPFFGQARTDIVDEQATQESVATPVGSPTRPVDRQAASSRIDVLATSPTIAQAAPKDHGNRVSDGPADPVAPLSTSNRGKSEGIQPSMKPAGNPPPVAQFDPTHGQEKPTRLPAVSADPVPTPAPRESMGLRAAVPVERRPEPRQPQPVAERSRDKSRPASMAAATEVHIHIGRIELSAAPPEKSVKPETRVGKKPLSLDEYLKQRGRSA